MHAQVLTAVCVLLATATDGAHGALFPRWLSRGQLPVPRQFAAAGLSPHKAPSAMDTAWSKMTDETSNSVLYFSETKHEVFVFGKAPAVNAPITTPEPIKASTSAPATNGSVSPTSTCVPAASTSAPASSTSVPASSTSVPPTSTSVPATSTWPSATSTSVPATSTSELTLGTDALSSTSNTLLQSSTIPPGYTYYPATGSYYKYHHKGLVSWNVANSTCASEGAHVLVINDAAEAVIVARIVKYATGNNKWIWTGLRGNRKGGVMEWRTVNGEPLSAVLHEWYHRRSGNSAERTCASYSTYYKQLDDDRCDETYYLLCEISQ